MDDMEKQVTDLKAQIASAREERLAAQKEASALPLLRRSLERVERDVSSGTTSVVESLGDEAERLREEITEQIHHTDGVRGRLKALPTHFKAGAEYQQMQDAIQVAEARQQALCNDPRAEQFDLARLLQVNGGY